MVRKMCDECMAGEVEAAAEVAMNYNDSLRSQALSAVPDFDLILFDNGNNNFGMYLKKSGRLEKACKKISAGEIAAKFAMGCYAQACQRGSKLKPEFFVYCALLADPHTIEGLADVDSHLEEAVGRKVNLPKLIDKLLRDLPEIKNLNGIFQRQIHRVF